MSSATPLQTAAVKPLQAERTNLFLQRKCACGGGASGLASECEECSKKRMVGSAPGPGHSYRHAQATMPSSGGGAFDHVSPRADGRPPSTLIDVHELIVSLTENQRPIGSGNILRSAGGGSCTCCPTCAEEDETIQRDALGPGPPRMSISQPGDPAEIEADRAADAVMRAPAASAEATVGPAAHTSGSSTGGYPLPEGTRRFFEPRFGYSFSEVRVLNDNSAARAARAVDAKAFTVGRNIVFGAGYWSPGSREGQRLLAHELAHVVQQENRPALQRMILRKECGHDSFKAAGCAGLGFTDAAGTRVKIALDTLIVEAGLNKHFPGTWLSQVYSPPNPNKGGIHYGKIDALKVKAGTTLNLEVLEIKSRNRSNAYGGCIVAMNEAEGYVQVLNRLAPKIAAISQRLGASGGYMIPDADGSTQCRSSAAKGTLAKAGVDTKDAETMTAWCVYNSIQTRMGSAFSQRFNSVNAMVNKDGTPATDPVSGYNVVSWTSGSCGKGRPARKRMSFQVNGEGGPSYRCDKLCPKDDEEEKQEREEEQRVIRTFDKTRRPSRRQSHLSKKSSQTTIRSNRAKRSHPRAWTSPT